MNTETIKKIHEFLKSNEEEILGIITDLAKHPSVAEKGCEGAPYGKPCRECLEAASEIMKRYGFESNVSKSGKYALATIGSGDKTIGLFAHTDVVPVNEADWIYTKPFTPVRIGDVLVGRGVEDNKAGVAASIFAVKALEYAGIPLKSRISVYLGSNEECGMDDILDYKSENELPDVSIVPDAGFPVSFGEKGICRAHVIPNGRFTDIVEFHGGTAYNIMLDHLTVKMKYKEELYRACVEICEKNSRLESGIDGEYITVIASGIPKHAAKPEGGINAANVFASAFESCSSLCKSDREILHSIATLTGDFYGEALGIAASDEWFGKLTSVNGMCSINKEGRAEITLDIRYCTTIDAKTLEKKILSAYPLSFISENSAGFAIPRDNPVASALQNVYRVLSGNQSAEGFYMGGGTYARYLKNAYSVGLQAPYVPTETPQLPDGHGDAHQADEILRIPQFLEGIKIIALMLSACDENIYSE